MVQDSLAQRCATPNFRDKLCLPVTFFLRQVSVIAILRRVSDDAVCWDCGNSPSNSCYNTAIPLHSIHFGKNEKRSDGSKSVRPLLHNNHKYFIFTYDGTLCNKDLAHELLDVNWKNFVDETYRMLDNKKYLSGIY